MIEVRPPEDFRPYLGKGFSIFAGGTIDMGNSEDWQQRLREELLDEQGVIFNPRRGGWDSSWVQTIENDHFRGQVEWELDALDACDLRVFYFAPGSQSPVTMLEVGLHAAMNPKKSIVCCPEGFWRKGNIDIVCKRFGVPQAGTFDQLVNMIRQQLKKAA